MKDNLRMAQLLNKYFAWLFNNGNEELTGRGWVAKGNKDTEVEMTKSEVELKLKHLNGT